jgi:hypothetical protein
LKTTRSSSPSAKKSGSTTARAIAKGAMQGEFALHAQGKARQGDDRQRGLDVPWFGAAVTIVASTVALTAGPL